MLPCVCVYGLNVLITTLVLCARPLRSHVNVSAFGACCAIPIRAFLLLSAYSIPEFNGEGKPCQRLISFFGLNRFSKSRVA